MPNDNHDMKISVWPNDRRENERSPHLTGSVTINGQKYFVSLWVQTKSGRDAPEDLGVLENCQRMFAKLRSLCGRAPVLSGRVSLPMNEQQGQPSSQQSGAPGYPESDIPF